MVEISLVTDITVVNAWIIFHTNYPDSPQNFRVKHADTLQQLLDLLRVEGKYQ